MRIDESDAFGEYIQEASTSGSEPIAKPVELDEPEDAKYGIGKPHRIILRGIIAANRGPNPKGE